MRFWVLFIISVISLNTALCGAARGAAYNRTEAFISGSIIVKGLGLAPVDDTLSPARKKVLSLRAAHVLALRAAAEAVDGVTVSGNTTVKDATTSSQRVSLSVSSFVRGAEVLSEEYDAKSGIATVTLKVPVTGSNGIVAGLMPGLTGQRPKLPYYTPDGKAKTGAGYDALIVDVRGLGFKPAILNRVITADSKVLFDPSMIEVKERGRGAAVGYTDSMTHAYELISETGAKNPLTIVPAGLAGKTDAVAGKKDSLLLFGANKATGLLQKGRVVFVLGGR